MALPLPRRAPRAERLAVERGVGAPGSGTRLPRLEPLAAAQAHLAPRLPVVGAAAAAAARGRRRARVMSALAAIASSVAGSSRPDRSPGASPVHDGADRAAQHLRAAGLGQRGREPHLRRAERRAEARRPRTSRARRGARRRRRRRARAPRTPRAPRPSPSSGTPTAAASTHRRVRDDDGLDLGRPEPLARELDRVVGAAVQEPLAVGGDRSRSRRATTRPASATSTCRGSAAGRANNPRVMPGHGFVHTSSPTAPRTGWPASSNTSTAMPSAGPPSEHGDIGSTTCGDEEARAHLGAARDVDHRAPAAADPFEVPAPRAFVPRLARRREDAQRRAGRARSTGSSPWAISARISVGETPSTFDAVPFDDRPEPVGRREVGRAVEEHERAAVGERADDLPRPHDPADVGEPEQPLARAAGPSGTRPPPRSSRGTRACTCTAPLGRPVVPLVYATKSGCSLSTGAASKRRVARGTELGEREVAAGASSAVVAAEPRHHDDGVHASAPTPPRRRRSPSSARRLPRRVKPSAVMSATALGVLEPDRDRVGAVAGEDRQEQRAELRDREQRGDRLGDHRQEEPDRVARRRRRAPRGRTRCDR